MKQPDLSARAAHSLNSNIRLYKYTPSQHFNPHYDDSIRDAKTGAVSEWTLLIYLTGVEDGVQGGEVRMIGSVGGTLCSVPSLPVRPSSIPIARLRPRNPWWLL